MQGQITPESKAGQLITKISSQLDVRTIVELGTWNGCGSTKCLIIGMDKNPNKHLITIELYPDQYQLANENLKNAFNVTLLHGSILTPEETLKIPKEEIDFNDLHAQLYYNSDIKYIESYPNVFHKIPDQIDFLVLDGGEYTTFIEWSKLKDRTSIVFLDDTNIFKCRKIKKELLKDPAWICIEDEPYSRNGYAAFKRK